MAIITTQFANRADTESAITAAVDALDPEQAFNAFDSFSTGLGSGFTPDSGPAQTNIHVSGVIDATGAIVDLLGNNFTAATTTATVLHLDYQDNDIFSFEHLEATTGLPGTAGGITVNKSTGAATGIITSFDYHSGDIVAGTTHIQFVGSANVGTGALTVKSLLFDFDDFVDDTNDITIQVGSTAGFTVSGTTGLVTGGILNSASLTVSDGVEHYTISATGLNVNALTFFETATAAQQFDMILSGNDVISAGADGQTLYGGAGNDFLDFNGHSGVIFVENASQGNDTVRLSDTEVDLSTFSGGNFENVIFAGEGSATLTGNAAKNVLTGGDGGNWLDGGAGADILNGGTGSDVYVVDNLLDKLGAEAEEGGDDIVYATVTWILGANFENLLLEDESNINGTGNALGNAIYGNDGNNILTGGDGNDYLSGGDGNDNLLGGNGDDELSGGDGNNVLDGGAGNDQIYAGTGANTMSGGLGDDSIVGGTGSNSINGGDGDNSINGGFGSNSIVAGLGNDVINGNSFVDNINGGAGDDVIDGGEASDVLSGGAGNDFLIGGGGDNSIDGGAGADLILDGGLVSTLLGGLGDDTISANLTGGKIDGGDGADLLVNGGNTNSTIIGGGGNDTIQIVSTTDSVVGGAGIDEVDFLGSGGTLTLEGTTENLVLSGEGTLAIGNALANTFTSSFGYNSMNGKGGNDIYNITVGDVVAEDSSGGGTDLVVFSSVGGSVSLGGGIENLTLLGNSISGTGNELANVLTRGDSGAGALDGLLNNDTYNVFADDYVTEADDTAHSGTDQVNAFLSDGQTWTLDVGLENLTLFDISEGTVYGNGNSLANKITGATTAGAYNNLSGNDGNDTLVGGVESDNLYGNNDNDSIAGAGGDDNIVGGDGNDTATGGDGNDGIYAGIGNDSIDGGAGSDVLDGSDGNDVLLGGIGNDYLQGGDGVDKLDGGAGNDYLDGGNSNDGIDTLVGGLGDDTFQRYLVNNGGAISLISASMDGGAGTDTVFLQAMGDNSPGTFNLNMTQPGFGMIENLDAGEAGLSINFNITGNGLNNALAGGGGNDTLNGGAGNDWLEGNGGNDSLIGGLGDDSFVIDLVNSIFLDTENGSYVSGGIALATSDSFADTGGSDTLVLRGGGGNADTLGSHDVYTYDVGANTQNPFENVDASDTDSIVGFNFTGTAAANRLVGGSGSDTITGNGGNDTLGSGNGGSDVLTGGTGNDTYLVIQGTQIIDDTGGTDTVIASLTNGQSFSLGEGTSSGLENLTLIDADEETDIYGYGNSLANKITGATNAGDSTRNFLFGNGGHDTITGGIGDDYLYGGDGNDKLDGGAGNDFLDGGEGGSDTLIGGLGDDTYKVDLKALAVGTLGDDQYKVDLKALAAGAPEDTITEAANGGYDVVYFYGNNSVTGFNYNAGTANIEEIYIHDESAAFNSTLTGGAAENYFVASHGNDKLDGGAGDDYLDGGEGGNDTLLGGLGNDFLFGGWSEGPNGNSNSLDGGAGDDTYSNGDGNDTMVIAQAGDTVQDDFGGNDTLLVSVIPNQFIDGEREIHLNYGGVGSGIENVTFTGTGAVGIFGNDNDNSFVGAAGNDTLDGGEGGDTLVGGLGDDNLYGGVSTYPFAAHGDSMSGGAGNDALDGGEGGDTMAGDLGNDSMYGGDSWYNGNWIFDLGDSMTGGAGNDTLDGGEGGNDTLLGGDGNDVLYGGSDNIMPWSDDSLVGGLGSDTLSGGLGNDTMYGDNNDTSTGGGADSLSGGDGNDSLVGGAGNDTLDGGSISFVNTMDGGAGADTYFVRSYDDQIVNEAAGTGAAFTDTAFIDTSNFDASVNAVNVEKFILQDGGVFFTGNAVANTITSGDGNDYIYSGLGNDSVDGGAGEDYLDGGDGNDVLAGGDGNDIVYGGAGNDNLGGGAGNDWISGGGGNDLMTGGDGDDKFDLAFVTANNVVTITDYRQGEDHLVLAHDDLNALFELEVGVNLINCNTVAAAVHSGTDPELIYEASTGKLYYDVNGSTAGGQTLLAVIDGTDAAHRPYVLSPDDFVSGIV